jgi:hypothetical protein
MTKLKVKNPPPRDNPHARRRGKGYKLGPRKPKPVSANAVWLTSTQVRERQREFRPGLCSASTRCL